MEKTIYIPGDLVMTNGVPLGTAQNVVYRVTSSDPSKTLELDDGTVLKGVVCLENIEGAEFGEKGYLSGDCCAWVKDIVPINLVPAILEKNGWEFIGYHMDNNGSLLNICSKRGILPHLYYYYATENFIVYICGKVALPNMKYIHELQHLLFGLGINPEMEV